ncbi:MAG: nucleotidyltransferase domain-containing protein, partial [Actinobacteria bacterium]|nr:nucleotidyltransferase domain-containing protein [Actinomycetota bacterium]
MKTIKYKTREKEVLDKIVALLKKNLNPNLILLFGSRAGKNYSPNSDFDIAVDGEKINIRELRELKEKIEKISGLYNVDIVFLESVDRDFKDIIIKRG